MALVEQVDATMCFEQWMQPDLHNAQSSKAFNLEMHVNQLIVCQEKCKQLAHSHNVFKTRPAVYIKCLESESILISSDTAVLHHLIR